MVGERTRPVWPSRRQVVTIPAERWHSHSAPSVGFDIDLGEAIPTVRATAAQATAVPMTRSALRLRDEPVIAVTPRFDLHEP
jgi:hypothetical protein